MKVRIIDAVTESGKVQMTVNLIEPLDDLPSPRAYRLVLSSTLAVVLGAYPGDTIEINRA